MPSWLRAFWNRWILWEPVCHVDGCGRAVEPGGEARGFCELHLFAAMYHSWPFARARIDSLTEHERRELLEWARDEAQQR